MLAFIDSVLSQFGVCPVPGVMNDFLFKPGHLGVLCYKTLDLI